METTRVFSGCKDVFQLSRLDSGQVKPTRNLFPFYMKIFHPPLLLQMERCAQRLCHLWPLKKLQHPREVITIFFQFSNIKQLTILILLGQPLSRYYYTLLYFHSTVLLKLHCAICTHKPATIFSNEIPICQKPLEPAMHWILPSSTVPYWRQDKHLVICTKGEKQFMKNK